MKDLICYVATSKRTNYRIGENAKNPEDGELIGTKTAAYAYAGFHRESLDGSIVIKNGEAFSVVATETVKDKDGATKYDVAASNARTEASAKAIGDGFYGVSKVNKGESFIFRNGAWADWTESDLISEFNEATQNMFVTDNFSIKAYMVAKKAENPIVAKGRTISAPVGKSTTYAKSTAFKISKAQGAVTFKKVSGSKKIAVNGKTGALTVRSGLKKGRTYKVKVRVSAAGTDEYEAAAKTVTVKVRAASRGTNPITAKGRTIAASAGKTKSFARPKALSVSRAQGKVSFKKLSGSKKVAVNKKTGRVTVGKGLKRGATYKVKVRVSAAGGKYYKKGAKTATLTVKVK